MTDAVMPKGKALPSDKPYNGERRDAKEARKIAERMSKPRPESAVKDHARRMKNLKKVSHVGKHNDHSVPACGPGKQEDVLFAEGKRGATCAAHSLTPKQGLTQGEWRHGPNGPIFVSLEGWGNPSQGERKSGEIVGKVRNTPVGQKTANARPNSPFKGAKGSAMVVKIRKFDLVNKPS